MFECPEAFSEFYDTTAIIAGQRAESGHVRKLRVSVPCCVFMGASEDQRSDAIAPADEFIYSVHFKKAAWKDAGEARMPPQIGDTLDIETHPALAVVSLRGNADEWVLTCKTTEPAK